MGRFSKLFGTLLGMVTPSGVAAVLLEFGVHVPGDVAAAIVTLLGALGAAVGVYVAPANKPKTVAKVDVPVPAVNVPCGNCPDAQCDACPLR